MNAESSAACLPAGTADRTPALEDLLRDWGLRHAPFTDDDKATEIFPAPSQREALPLLDTTAALRGLMVLTGPPGSGKSALLKSWLPALEPKRHLPLLITQSSLSAAGVLEMILAKLGESPRFKRSANLLALEARLAQIAPLTLVLVLDDAHNYPAPALEEIRLLLGLGGGRRPAFALVLLGDQYLLGGLRLAVQRALFSRISAAHQLAPLPRELAGDYLYWHLRRAGMNRDVFQPAAIDLLAEAAEGSPRTLNLLAQAAWLAAARQGRSEVQPDHVHLALRQVPAAAAKLPER